MTDNPFVRFSESIAQTVEQAGQYVVQVDGRRRFPASGIVWSADGIIVTAHHVLEGDENFRVGLPGDEYLPANLVGRDPTTDLAVLRIDRKELAPLPSANSDEMRVGQIVLAIGRPGRHIMATWGITSILEESWRTHSGGLVDKYIQTSVLMLPGFSGGPLVSAGGELLGMNTSALLRDSSITIPPQTMERVVNMLLTHGRIRRAYMGVSTQPVRLPEALVDQLGQDTGLMITTVEGNTPASEAGLLQGDVLISLEGQKLRHMDDFMAALSPDRVGRSVPIQIIRGGQKSELNITLGERT